MRLPHEETIWLKTESYLEEQLRADRCNQHLFVKPVVDHIFLKLFGFLFSFITVLKLRFFSLQKKRA